MAKASKTTITRTVEETGIRLDLSMDEARLLQTLFYKVGGDRFYSARKHSEEISSALSSAGVSLRNHFSATGCINIPDDL